MVGAEDVAGIKWGSKLTNLKRMFIFIIHCHRDQGEVSFIPYFPHLNPCHLPASSIIRVPDHLYTWTVPDRVPNGLIVT